MHYHRFNNTFLDLGSSINVLSFEIYQQFGFKGMLPTDSVIQLADNSVVYPRGLMPNVVIRVGDFYYTVDFTICDIHQSSTPGELYVLLGRPFLATSNARIDCNTG